MKIVFFGTPDFVVPILSDINSSFDLVAVVTNPDRPAGRHQELLASPVKTFASKITNLKILTPETLDQQLIDELTKLSPDIFIVAAYGKIIPIEILNLPVYGSLNIHPSLLPKYRGSSPIQACLLNGDKETGVSVIKMDDKMDHGPILAQANYQIETSDNFHTLSNKLFQISINLLKNILQQYANGKLLATSQDDKLATYTWKTSESKQKAYFDIDQIPSAEVLDRMSRAFYPWPAAWTRWKDRIVKILPGKKIQIEGKKPVNLEEFLRGYPDFPIKSF